MGYLLAIRGLPAADEITEPARVRLRGDAFRGFEGKGAGAVLFAVKLDSDEKWRLTWLNSSSCNRKY